MQQRANHCTENRLLPVQQTVLVVAVEYSFQTARVDTRQHLRSANHQLLAVPRYRLNAYGRRAFSVAGPTV